MPNEPQSPGQNPQQQQEQEERRQQQQRQEDQRRQQQGGFNEPQPGQQRDRQAPGRSPDEPRDPQRR